MTGLLRHNREKGARRVREKRPSRYSLRGSVGIWTILILISAFMLLPFVYAILQSLKPIEEIFAFPPRFFVRNPTMDNYQRLFMLTDGIIPTSRYFANSIFITLTGTFLAIAMSCLAAFPMAKYPFPGSKALFSLIIAALLFTASTTAVPRYILLANMGLINTFWTILLPAFGTPLGLFLMKNFMGQISDTILEAASIDGAGIMRTLVSIAMPMVKPALFTLGILNFQSLWNSTDSGQFIYDERLKLIPVVMTQISQSGVGRTGPYAAAIVFMMIPPLIIFITTQSRVIETMAHSGIKG
jgi:ABC-type glycerol-3-phosphate transport system permease component